jgi:ABC-type taurine transport system substrate-binding protein
MSDTENKRDLPTVEQLRGDTMQAMAAALRRGDADAAFTYARTLAELCELPSLSPVT